MKSQTILVAVAAILAGTVTVARADAAFEPRSVTVRFADLDTTSAQGAAVLYRRLKSAAENVCHDLQPGRQLARMRPYADCTHQALSGAIVKLALPAVTAYAESRGVPSGESTIRIAANK